MMECSPELRILVISLFEGEVFPASTQRVQLIMHVMRVSWSRREAAIRPPNNDKHRKPHQERSRDHTHLGRVSF